jgi:hypothetical protein
MKKYFSMQHANLSSRGNHFKNGVMPKSQMSKGYLNYFYVSLLLLAVFFCSCEKSSSGFTVTFNVASCNMQWTQDASAYTTAADAEVKIYQGEKLVKTCLTNAEGIAVAQLEAGDYSYTVTRGDEKNISAEGYIIKGIFTSQDEIYNNPAVKTGESPNGGNIYLEQHPGDLKYADINNDFVIDSQDAVEKAPLYIDNAAKVSVYIASDLNFSTALALETGLLIKKFYVGAYFDRGFNSMQK